MEFSRSMRSIPLAGKLRFDRGCLRWWLIVVGLLAMQPGFRQFVLGTTLVVLGAVLHFVSKGYLRANAELTVRGPYRFTRNPFYLANLIVEGGLLVIIGNSWVAAIYLAVWWGIYHQQIKQEEHKLVSIFGDEFSQYCRSVPRLVPRPTRFLPRDRVTGPGFSLRNPNIAQGRQIERTLRLLSYPLLFWTVYALSLHEANAQLQWNTGALSAATCCLALNGLGWAISFVRCRSAALG